MKRTILVIALIVAGVGLIFLVNQAQKKPSLPKKTIYPATAVRQAVKGIKASDVGTITIVIPSQTIILDKQSDIAPLLEGLKSAVWPCDPKMLPGNRTLSVKLILKNGQTIGPFGFSNETPDMAFGVKFAEAYNNLNPRLKVKMSKGKP